MGMGNPSSESITKATSHVLAARNAVNANLVAFSDGSDRAVANALGRAAKAFIRAGEELTGTYEPFRKKLAGLHETVAGKYDALYEGYRVITDAEDKLWAGKIGALDGMGVVDDAVDAYLRA